MKRTADPIDAPSISAAVRPPERMLSIDALRGFDMFWIIGAGALVHALDQMQGNAAIRFFSTQLSHAEWRGFRFYDLIFPLFLFLVGISIEFSLRRALPRDGMRRTLIRIVRRTLLLYVLGVFYNGGLAKAWPAVQLGGVLQRIAACYGITAMIYCLTSRPRSLTTIAIACLLIYWALLAWIPFPDLKLDPPTVNKIARQIGSDDPAAIAGAIPNRIHGIYEEGRNLTNYVDFRLLPGQKPQHYYINEGLLSTLPAIALCLFGIIAGQWLTDTQLTPSKRAARLAIYGIAAAAIGVLWGFEFPIIKRIWTSSFVMLAAGCSAILTAGFFWIIDVKGWRGWCRPFIWIGANALTLYLARNIIKFSTVSERLAGGSVKAWFDMNVTPGFGSLVVALISLALVVGLARFLYTRKIFIRL